VNLIERVNIEGGYLKENDNEKIQKEINDKIRDL
jgi:hypothetical protein